MNETCIEITAVDPPRVCLGSTTSITLTGRGFTNQLNQNRSACRFQISEDEFLCKLVIYPPHTHTPTHLHTHTPTHLHPHTHTPTPPPHTHTHPHTHTPTPTKHKVVLFLCTSFVVLFLIFWKKKTMYRELEYWMIKTSSVLCLFVPVLPVVTFPTEQIQYNTIVCPSPQLNHTGYMIIYVQSYRKWHCASLYLMNTHLSDNIRNMCTSQC